LEMLNGAARLQQWCLRCVGGFVRKPCGNARGTAPAGRSVLSCRPDVASELCDTERRRVRVLP
jgi:hypothetical protein